MSLAPDTRRSLVLRSRNPRDEQAWEDFLEIYQPLLRRLLVRSGLQEADVDEVTQEALTSVAAAVSRFDPDRATGSFRGWLLRIARNAAINFVQRQCRRPRASGDSEVLALLESQPDPSPAESAVFDLECRRQAFHWAAEQVRNEVHPTTWQAFWRTCVEGEPLQAVAQELGLSPGALYVARSRVMARLRSKIETLLEE